MFILFLRHAEAEADADDDFGRELTAKGLEQAQRVGKYCARHGLVPDVLLTSPVVRARQTAEVVASRLDIKAFESVDWLASGMAPETCLSKLRGLKGVGMPMLVGHEPDFSEVIAVMLGCGVSESLRIRKACLVGLDADQLRRGRGVIELLVPARLM